MGFYLLESSAFVLWFWSYGQGRILMRLYKVLHCPGFLLSSYILTIFTSTIFYNTFFDRSTRRDAAILPTCLSSCLARGRREPPS